MVEAGGMSSQTIIHVIRVRREDDTYVIHSPIKAVKSLRVYRNRLRMKPGFDYTRRQRG
jgi:hypothetical protein